MTYGPFKGDAQRLRLGDVAVFENRQPITAAKFINKSLFFILLLVVILFVTIPVRKDMNRGIS